MKKITVINYSNNNSLFVSVVFLILGIILFTNPGNVLNFISYIIGSILIIIGGYNILSYNKILKNLNIEKKSKLVSGIILIICGLAIILFNDLIETTIRLILGGIIIYTGIIRLIDVINNYQRNSSSISRLIVSILIIICGFYVSLKKDLIFSTIGLFIIIYAILEIIDYIFYNNKQKNS